MSNKEQTSLHSMAVQMFKDCYVQTIRGKYGLCYYMKTPNGRGAYVDIKTTERILADIPLKELSPDLILEKYKRIQKTKKQSVNDDTSYYGVIEEYRENKRRF